MQDAPPERWARGVGLASVLRKGETAGEAVRQRWRDVLRFNRIDRRTRTPAVSLKVPAASRKSRISPRCPPYTPGEITMRNGSSSTSRSSSSGIRAREAWPSPRPIAVGGRRKGMRPRGGFSATHQPHHVSTAPTGHDGVLHGGHRHSYPMTWPVRFTSTGRSHVLDPRTGTIPGHRASHGCVGLYDEAMQKKYYPGPRTPVTGDAAQALRMGHRPLPGRRERSTSDGRAQGEDRGVNREE